LANRDMKYKSATPMKLNKDKLPGTKNIT